LPSDVASPDHLCFARVSWMFSIAGNVEESCGVAGVCDIYDQSSISLSDSGEGIEGGSHSSSYIDDPALALSMDNGMVGGAPLEIVKSDPNACFYSGPALVLPVAAGPAPGP